MSSWWKFLIAVETPVLLFLITGEASIVEVGCLYVKLIDAASSQILDASEAETKENVLMQSAE